MTLAGKNVVVTGASRGIGRALTDEAVARGARVYAAVRQPDAMHDAVALHGDQVVPVVLDLGEPATIAALAHRCPDVDLLVHNAGVPLPGAALDVPMPDLRQVFETNFFGPLELLRAFAAPIAARGGGVLVVTSQAGLILSRSSPLYSASKAALTMAVLGMRAQLRAAGVPVAVVFPGMVDTEMTAAMSGPKTAPSTVAANVFDAYARGEQAIFPDAHSREVRAVLHEHYLETLENPQPVAELALARLSAQAAK
jgi:NAD(P)-dependent dehydrogenase (short-subunit alcohol dehydrogenase family)